MATSIRRTTTIARTVNLSVVSKHQSGGLLADLFTAYYCARKNKRNTSSQTRFERGLSDNLMRLYDDIVSGRYRVGRSMCFVIRDPVLREVFAASFRDRIVHHLLYNWLMPIFEPTFIYDSYSCREGKGTLFGIKRLEHHIRTCSDNYRKECYVLKLDIEGYFMNISRQRLYDMIVSRLQKYSSSHRLSFDLLLALRLLSQVIFNDPVKGCYRKGRISDWKELPFSKSLFHAAPGCGLPIGNLTSQLFSNIYLSGLDDYVKRVLKFRHYGRYVDDFYIVGSSKDELLDAIPDIRSYLSSELGLRLHPRKVHLTDIRKGVRFLGAVVKPHQRYICPRGVSRARAHMNEVLTAEYNPYRILSVLQSYAGYQRHFHNEW
ncbi:MAG: group II intron reverse transcriptase domain-containing protein [Bacteroidales bacterium]|nr:group II intron reverse transcriptase domain-containing protein [Bacteroidales bacterium]